MSFFRRMFFFLLINILVVTTASILALFITTAFGIKGEWGFYIVFYSIIGFGGAFISLALSRYLAKKMMGVRVIDPQKASGQELDLVNMVYQMATQARLPNKPEVGIYESPQPNAFATGPSKKKSLVAVSRGLLQSMSKDELEGVIAHEVAHISNGDMVTMTLLQGMINTMVLLAARAVAKLIASRMRDRSIWVEHLIFIGLQIAFSILGSIALCYFSRKREYRADKDGARFSSVPNMISALKALQRMTSVGPTAQMAFAGRGNTESYNYLQISGKDKRANWFSTHPPLENRIARLERLYS
ncbi:MAG: protease HtpX [Bdellovibrionaceae bacterium]|nr:protease HtpX [Pseudobdellovibrionaceae bacterium]